MAPISGSRAVQLTCRSTHRSSADLGIGRMFRYRPEIFGASFAIFLRNDFHNDFHGCIARRNRSSKR